MRKIIKKRITKAATYQALRTNFLYLIFGISSALFLDIVLSKIKYIYLSIWQIKSFQEWLFVALTSILMYLLVKRIFNSKNKEKEILKQELSICKELIRNSEQKYSRIFENAPIGIFHSTLEGRILLVNPILAELFGYKRPEDMISANINAAEKLYMQSELRNQIVLKAIESKRFVNSEVNLKRLNGDSFIANLKMRIVKERNSEQEYIEGFIEDITKRKMTEYALKESEKHHRSVVTSLHEGIIIHSSNGMIEKMNKRAQEILELTNEEISGRQSIDIKWRAIHEDGSPFPGEMHPAMMTLQTGKPESNVIMGLKKPNGELVWIAVNSEPLFNDNQTYAEAVIVSITNITERKNAEMGLKESEAKYRELFENNLAGVFRNSINGEVLDCNPAFAKIFGFKSKEEGLHKLAADFYPSPKGREKYLELLSKKGQLLNYECQRKRVDGSTIWTLENVRMAKNQAGAPLFIEGTIFDVTELKQAESQIIKERNQAKLYFEAAGVMLAQLDKDGNISLMNKKGSEILEYSADEIIGKNWFNLVIQKEIREKLRSIFNNMVNGETEDIEYFENEVVCKSGIHKMIAFHNSVIRSGDSGIIGILFSGEDITNRKKVEKLLRDNEQRLTLALEATNIGLWDWDIENDIWITNPTYFKMLGYDWEKKEELIESWNDKVHPLDKEFVLNNKKRNEFDIEYRLKHADGSFRWINSIGRTIEYKKNGDAKRMIGLQIDITERKQNEEEIRKLSKAIEQIPVSVVITDLEGNIEYVNPFYLTTTGYNYNEVLGKNPRILKSGYTSQNEYTKLWDTILAGNVWDGIFQNKNKNGELIWESSIISPTRNLNGDITHFIQIKEDITQKVKTEEELRKYREGLETLVKLRTEQLNEVNMHLREEIRKEKEYELLLQESLDKEKELSELKTRFVSITSHEFRTPLTSILGSIELIQMYREKWSKGKLNEQIERIINSVEYLTRLLDDVLTLSHAESGKLKFKPEILNLYDFCSGIIEELGMRSRKDHEFIFNYKCPQKIFSMDSQLLRFILVNLLSNAYKYSPGGGKIEFSVSSDDKNIEFIISDEGIGIPDKDKKYLFNPFHRCSNSLKIPGTGLGLSIVKHSIELHNGGISYSSEAGLGTTFKVLIPKG